MPSASAWSRGLWVACSAPNPASALTRDLEGGAESSEILRPEDDAISCRHVDEIEVDPGLCDLASQVGEDARPVLDVHNNDLALAGDRDMRDRQRMLHRLGMRHKDVDLGPVAWPHEGGRSDVDACVADRGGHLGQRARGVLDVDYQVDCHLSVPCPAYFRVGARAGRFSGP